MFYSRLRISHRLVNRIPFLYKAGWLCGVGCVLFLPFLWWKTAARKQRINRTADKKRKRPKRIKVKDNGDAVRKGRRKSRTSKGASVSKVYSLEESDGKSTYSFLLSSLLDLMPIFLSISRGTENEWRFAGFFVSVRDRKLNIRLPSSGWPVGDSERKNWRARKMKAIIRYHEFPLLLLNIHID